MSLLKVRVGGSRYLCKWNPHSNEVKIGGRRYPYVQIGRQLWITENLDWKWDGLTIGAGISSSQRANYYDDDEVTYGWDGRRCGLLYNPSAVSNLTNLLPSDWRVPTSSDWTSLISSLGTTPAVKASKQVSWEPNWTGTDDYGFGAIPSGQRYGSDGSFHEIGSNWVFWDSELNSYVRSGNSIGKDPVVNNSQYSLRLCKDATVNIGGRDYPTTRIGNQIWLAENLDWKLDGITIGASGDPTTPSAWYYNNDEATYGVNGNRCGLLYNWYSISTITSLLPIGWRVPTLSEYETLVETVGGASTAGTKLKSSSMWLSNAGTNDFGFSSIPTGFRFNGTFTDISNQNQNTNYWTYDEYSSSAGNHVRFSRNSTDATFLDSNKIRGYSIRLVKDAT